MRPKTVSRHELPHQAGTRYPKGGAPISPFALQRYPAAAHQAAAVSQLESIVFFKASKSNIFLKTWIAPVLSTVAALGSQLAHAGPALPWDGPITTVVNNLTGPVATGISTVAFLAAGAALILVVTTWVVLPRSCCTWCWAWH